MEGNPTEFRHRALTCARLALVSPLPDTRRAYAKLAACWQRLARRPGKRTAALPVQAPLELEPTSRSRGSAFVGLRKRPRAPQTTRKEN